MAHQPNSWSKHPRTRIEQVLAYCRDEQKYVGCIELLFCLTVTMTFSVQTWKFIGLMDVILPIYQSSFTEIRSKIREKLENWHSQRGPRWGHVTLTLTFDLLTPKSIGVFLPLSSICVWSMKSLGQTLFKLSRYNKVWTDGQTDRQTDRQGDYYRAPASSMAGP